MGVESVVIKSAILRRVRRRAVGSRGSDGRWTDGAEVFAMVKLAVQPTTADTLARTPFGDRSIGDVDVWASLTGLAAAYDEDDDSTPLGWTELLVAPAKGETGPRGDYVEWNGRIYEITAGHDHTESGLLPNARIKRYSASDRGAA